MKPNGKVIIAPNGFRYKTQYYTDKEGNIFKYMAMSDKRYYSTRYNKYVWVLSGMRSDGATGAFDIPSFGWWVHDKLCNTGCWEDGEKVSNWQASRVLCDILKSEGRWVRDWWWLWATFLMGGGEARKNGMFKVRKES